MLKRITGPTFRHGLLISYVIIILVPIAFLFLTSLKLFRDIISGSFIFTPTLVNYQDLFSGVKFDFLRATVNTIIASVGTTTIVLTIASLGAYSLSRFRWPQWWKTLVMGGLLLIYLLPPIIFIGPFYLLSLKLGIYDTPLAIIMAHTAFSLPMAVSMLFGFFANVPKEIEDAAHIDGASNFQTFFKVILPIIKPGLAASGALIFLFSWREFMLALSLTTTSQGMTVPVGVASFVEQYNILYGGMSASAFISMLPALVLVILAQRNIVKGLTFGAVKG